MDKKIILPDKEIKTIRGAIIFMMIYRTWQFIAMITIFTALLSFVLYGSINTKWFHKEPIKILENR